MICCGAKCEAKAYGSPRCAASCAPKVLEPRIHTGTSSPAPGTARTACCGFFDMKSMSSITSCGNWSASDSRLRRRARAVRWSEPGARPRPRSMRPGYSDSSVPNCSAITSGEWLGSITPPAPMRMVEVPAPTCDSSTAVAALAMPGMPWCSASQ
ncbi:hypothetical protein D9M68_647050 [compost metagenome]